MRERANGVQKEFVMYDPMTNIVSKEGFEYLLRSEGRRAVRYSYFISLLTFAADQEEGGVFLAGLAGLVRRNTRASDVLGWVHEDRFSVILPHAETPMAFEVGNRIRERVERYCFNLNKDRFHLTVSVGAVCFPTHTADIEDLLRASEEMLWKAKSLGGNRVSMPQWE